ncbi:hypothetical protein [Hyphomicrobium sulfonivorans]|uniref:hypothetical protein n=1 Tax=Hyphomicrobium sulfonivorans TaxID=121290 RepID=UPI00156F6FBC|nr:hypothetical protein [Hyphomicrobium sulfonivorans]MBI1649062.1 hypothetical protein [Hyphomicrobium sulfonivorans]
MRREELIALMEGAFRRNSPVLPSSLMLSPSNLPEVEEIAAELEKHSDLDDCFVEKFHSALPFFSEQGMAMILPEFIIYALKHPDSEVEDQVVSALSWLSEDDAFLTRLTREQVLILADVSTLFSSDYPLGTNYQKKLAEFFQSIAGGKGDSVCLR